ncbi:type IV secretion system protein [Pseudoxanthomonas sp. JBR18]|uniref:virB8 family protein n=1 Tax=Pseudoxanthomonas sp. JBR18 TaxID=2969308 RepID=UPI00230603AF|nr:type IV secretion system protein [Pseudoxanthomonas sp. JBR18]WCE04608.1 type IV secretion system protein [Pseudoxanthomonas sp. JBR18]
MITRKKEETAKVKSAINKAVSYELTIADMAKRSERRAWQVATGAIMLSLVLAAGYFVLLPLKEKTPFIVLADPYTGNVQASRLVGDVMDKRLTMNEAINRANVDRYVLARESYDADLTFTPLGGWRHVYATSSSAVAASYRALFSKNNPASPINTMGRQSAIRVKILSTVLVRTPDGRGYRGATVRFQRFQYDKKNGMTQPLDNKLATIDYEYNPGLKFEDQDRVINPMGFQVTSYRLDDDAASLPPAETLVEPAQGGASAPAVSEPPELPPVDQNGASPQ